MPHYRLAKAPKKALTFVPGEMGLRKCMSPSGFDLPMRPPWRMGAFFLTDAQRIDRMRVHSAHR
ncbi:hypothetical protein S1OALGB6SA_275, partial [Olavius algarvensis spirochete endosymbiont]